VASAAARALLHWGDDAPLTAVRSRPRFVETIGLDAAELLVLAGSGDDLPHLERVLRRAPPGRAHLSILGRFGHARAFAFLARCLEDDDLADDAAAALASIFGDLTPPGERRSPRAWRAAVAAAKPAPEVRLRRGRPYRPAVVVDECRDLDLPSIEIAARLDELCLRSRLPVRVAIDAFLPALRTALDAAFAAASKADRAAPAGAW
jgi:hypothetical protein